MSNFTKEKQPYFNIPTQVLFFDNDGTEDLEHPQYIPGIAYQDFIICGCCGGIFTIQCVWEDGIDAGVQPIYPYESWVSLNETITGDEAEEALKEPDVYFGPLKDWLENSDETNV